MSILYEYKQPIENITSARVQGDLIRISEKPGFHVPRHATAHGASIITTKRGSYALLEEEWHAQEHDERVNSKNG